MQARNLTLILMIAACGGPALAADSSAAVAAAEPAAAFQDLRKTPSITGNAQAGEGKAVVCQACHGPQGHSMVPMFPTLAGQPATYTYLQLQDYKAGRRHNEVMSPQAQTLSDEDMRDLAAYFAAQVPVALSAAGAAEDLLARGRQLYQQGEPKAGIPPCQACHGADGRGVRAAAAGRGVPWHTYPALAGQQAVYVAAQLQAFKDGSRAGSSNARVMHGVVQQMDTAAMQAVGAYVAQSLPPAKQDRGAADGAAPGSGTDRR